MFQLSFNINKDKKNRSLKFIDVCVWGGGGGGGAIWPRSYQVLSDHALYLYQVS